MARHRRRAARGARLGVRREPVREQRSPDGLDKVATDAGFADAEQDHGTGDGPLAGYEVEGVDDASLSTGVAGVVGVVLTFGLGMLLFGVLRTRARRAEDRVEAGP